MNSTMNSIEIDKLRLSLKWSWAGPVAGIACMIALFIAGIVTHTSGMTIMAASLAAALGGMWVGVSSSLRRKIADQR